MKLPIQLNGNPPNTIHSGALSAFFSLFVVSMQRASLCVLWVSERKVVGRMMATLKNRTRRETAQQGRLPLPQALEGKDAVTNNDNTQKKMDQLENGVGLAAGEQRGTWESEMMIGNERWMAANSAAQLHLQSPPRRHLRRFFKKLIKTRKQKKKR